MTSSFLDDTRSLQKSIDDKAFDLFKAKEGDAPLQVTRVPASGDNRELVSNEDIWNGTIPTTDYSLELFKIRQDRSWSTLNLARETFEEFMSTQKIFPTFWKCMFTFGRKTKENEFQFPGFNRRKTRKSSPENGYTHEFSYILKRVDECEIFGDSDPQWRIRQTAVYHQLSLSQQYPRSKMVLVAPSPNAEAQYIQYLEASVYENRTASVWNVHRVLIADSVRGWISYMASIQKRLCKCSTKLVLTTTGTSKERSSDGLTTDFVIDFEDRQELKILEDLVVDLQVIIPTLLKTVREIQRQYELCSIDGCVGGTEPEIELESIKDEFVEYVAELELCQDRALALQLSAKTTTQMLSDLLKHEEAVALKQLTKKSQEETVALKELAKQSHEESSSMVYLAEKSTKDAAAVKILTVITLIYLPTTIVANFFSTEFVQTNASGHMTLSNNFWLLFAIAIPLTAVTVLLWWAWVRFTEGPKTASPGGIRREFSFGSSMPRFKQRHTADVEKGLGPGERPPAPQFVDSWATTVRSK